MRYILSLGTNVEPREDRLKRAVDWLSSLFDLCFCSTPYETAPIGSHAGNERLHYLNAVAVIESDISRDILDTMLKNYEVAAGRTNEARQSGLVAIDIDIVIAGSEIVRQKDYGRYYFRQGYEELLSMGLSI